MKLARRLFALLVAALALHSVCAAAVGPAPRAVTALGEVEGVAVDGLSVFKGIAYAAPPIGERRWQAPQPVAPWRGVRSAKQFGAACMQKPGLSLEGGGDPGPLSEDCLYLNVWTPRADPGARLPVMVWLHGGALIFGAGSLKLYDGATLARQDMVVVTVNYRLGPLGYFVHPALEKASSGGAANFGLLDQIAALRWVQSHIEAFGGDPKQVTVAGQSAGAQSVLALMASPLATGFFQRAIAQSPYGIPSHTRTQARQVGVRVAEALGLPGDQATADQLRAVSAEKLANLEGKGLSLAPSLIVGDAAMPRGILASFQAQRQAAVPLMIGSNSDETSVALAFGLDPAALVKRLGVARIGLAPLYADVSDDAELGRQVVRDVAFTAYVRRIAVLQSKRATTRRYYFDHVATQARDQQPGAAHGGEVTAVFSTGDLCACLAAALTDADRLTWQGLADRWGSFVRTGRPDMPTGPVWPPDSLWKPVVLVFGDSQTVQPRFMGQRLNVLIGGLRLVGRGQPSD